MHFRTDTNVLVAAITAEQMAEVDRVAIEETGPTLFQMMENAGRNLASLVIARRSASWRTSSVLVLAGTGGNGGGGITAGRHLANRGIAVEVCVTHPDRVTGVPAAQLQLLVAAGGRVVTGAPSDPPSTVVDAVIGYSLSGTPRGAAARLIDMANALTDRGADVISLDVPSGVDATSGDSPGVVVRPAATMTLALPKTGLVVPGCGRLYLADIGIPAEVYRRSGIVVEQEVFDDRFVIPISVVQ